MHSNVSVTILITISTIISCIILTFVLIVAQVQKESSSSLLVDVEKANMSMEGRDYFQYDGATISGKDLSYVINDMIGVDELTIKVNYNNTEYKIPCDKHIPENINEMLRNKIPKDMIFKGQLDRVEHILTFINQ